jgi:rod shape-determining protein MreD
MRHTLVVFLTLLVLWVIIAQVNHALAGFHVYVFAGGLFVAYAALALPLRAGLAAVLLGGLLCDASAPVPFGTHLFLFAVAHAIVFHIRDRVPRDETVARIIITLLANLGLFLALSFALVSRNPSPAVLWPRLIIDLIVSQLLIALIAPWFFALQARSLIVARIERDPLA